jgi:hypothetical protein
LFALLFFFLLAIVFSDLPILITPLISSNTSQEIANSANR